MEGHWLRPRLRHPHRLLLWPPDSINIGHSQWSQRPNLPHKFCPKYHRNIPLPVKFPYFFWDFGRLSRGSWVSWVSWIPQFSSPRPWSRCWPWCQHPDRWFLCTRPRLSPRRQAATHVFERFWQTPKARTEAKMKSFHSQFGNSSPSHFLIFVGTCVSLKRADTQRSDRIAWFQHQTNSAVSPISNPKDPRSSASQFSFKEKSEGKSLPSVFYVWYVWTSHSRREPWEWWLRCAWWEWPWLSPLPVGWNTKGSPHQGFHIANMVT